MLRSAYKTDVGRVRSVNEDRVVVQPVADDCLLAMVADGMGGHQAGETASQMTAELLTSSLQSSNQPEGITERATMVGEAIRQANARVFEVASMKEHYFGMGTTVTIALVDEKQVVIGHIGDSRAYLINHDEFSQLTEDHTLVNELLKTKQISQNEAAQHPMRNVVTRALGTESTVEVDIANVQWKKGDTLLICSDGLSNMIGPEDLKRTVCSNASIDVKVDQLMTMALQAGGEDNITVVLVSND
jgi:serine/threonine protein phosphatase PrpC